MSLDQEQNKIEKLLVRDDTNLVITIVAYCLLIITTGFIGLGFANNFKLYKYKLSSGQIKSIKYEATIGLVLVWTLLLVTNIIKLKNGTKTTITYRS